MEAHIHTYTNIHHSFSPWLISLLLWGLLQSSASWREHLIAEAMYLLVDGKESQEDTVSPHSLGGPREIPHQLPAASQAADQCFTA